MRKCLRCESMMIEDLEVMVSYGGYGVVVKENGIFKKIWVKSYVLCALNAVMSKHILITPMILKN